MGGWRLPRLTLAPSLPLQLESVVVTGVVKAEERGYTALQVGAGLPKPKTLTRAERGKAAMAGHDPRSHYAEFRVTPEALLPVGTPVPVQHFVPGQYVCVRGKTQGKGFQGGMKRWGFKGLRASHGVSVSHRSLGSTGNRQDPGKVIKVRAGHGGARLAASRASPLLLLLRGVVFACRARRCPGTWAGAL